MARSFRSALLAVLAIALTLPAAASAGTATFTYPADGATNVDITKPFTWTATVDASAYYLYVGTSRGAKDLVDSGETAATSHFGPKLPANQLLWARIWTKTATTWTYQDISFTAAPITTTKLTYPRDGAQDIDPALPFTWYVVDGAESYYLYLGTTKGAKDLLDTRELRATSYQVPPLPTGQTVYARVWSKRNGAWSYTDSTFTAAAPSRATLSYPRDGALNVDTSREFSWYPVPSGEAYYLYVGTSRGAKDLAQSGSVKGTSWAVPPLPTGRTLWARVWTQVGGAWTRYSDVSFEVTTPASRLTYPKPDQKDVDTRNQFKWYAVPEAQGYYLKIGTARGANDVLDSGTLSGTSYTVPPLPVGRQLWARLYTRINNSWSTYTDISFVTAYSTAKLTYPSKANAPHVDQAKPLRWTPVEGVSEYALWIGTSPGASDVVQRRMSSTSYTPDSLPVGGTLWARVWTLSSGVWIPGADVPFAASARILAPAQRSIAVDRTQPVTWAAGSVVNGKAPAYTLLIGTTPGAGDLYDSGRISATSVTVPASAMPPDRPLYARVKVHLGNGSQRVADAVFATGDGSVAPSDMTWGEAGSDAVDVSRPFAWTATDLAEAYELEILPAEGGAPVADSGPIRVPRWFAETLPLGSYVARLGTKLGGEWSWTTSPFTVVANGASPAQQVAAAHWAVDYVRHMADFGNYTYRWTDLWDVADANQASITALCNNYSVTLVGVLKQMNVTASQPSTRQPRVFTTYFNALNDHTMVEFWDAAAGAWIVLDPTFDMAMRRASDGGWATIADAHAATVGRDWSAIEYVPLGEYGDSIARAYYLDYPLLYLNPPGQSPWLDPLPFMTRVDPMPSNQPNTYVVTSNVKPVTILRDGAAYQPQFSTKDSVSRMFQARTIAMPEGSTADVAVYTAERNVFTPSP